MIKILRRIFLILLLPGMLLSACSVQKTTELAPLVSTTSPASIATSTRVPAIPTPAPTRAIEIKGSGATFPQLVYAEWTYAYSYVDPTVKITYQGIGSSGGKQAIINRTVDFAGSDSLLSPEEYQAGKDLQMYPVIAGAVVIIYNFKPVKNYPSGFTPPAFILDRQSLVDIYNGAIRKWNDPRLMALNPLLADYLPAAPITAVHRSDGSGTTELFTKALSAFSSDWKAGGATTIDWPVDKAGTGMGGKGNQGIAAAVINTPNSLGYVELSYALSNSLAFADMMNKSGVKVSANAESLASAINDFGTANFDQQLTATIVDGGGSGSWPISGYTYLILHTTTMTDCVKARKLLEYIRWTLTDPSAGDRAAKLGYVVLPDFVRHLVLTRFKEVTCLGQPVVQ